MRNLSISSSNATAWWRRIVIGSLLIPVGVAILAVVASQDQDLWNKLVIDPTSNGRFYGGDMFGMSMLRDFQDQITIQPQADSSSTIDSAKYIAKGDSFFATGYDSAPVYNFLQDNLKGGVFYKAFPNDPSPLDFLKQAGYKKGGPKIFIWETAELYSIDRAVQAVNTAGVSGPSATPSKLSGLTAAAENFANLFKPNRGRFEYFMENNILVEPLRTWIKNQTYRWFGDTDGETPVYSTNPNMLFLDEDVAFQSNSGKTAQIPELTDDIASLAGVLKRDYNLQLVYVIIPNKLSIYADLIRQPNTFAYDGFIPKLQNLLAQKGVPYVDVYGAYLAEKQAHPSQLLYYPGDHHFTALGKSLMETELMKTINNLPK